MEITINKHKYLEYFSGKISEKDNINFIFKKTNQNFNENVLNFIQLNWKDALSKKPDIYNGELYDIINIENKNNKINIIYDIIDYKTSIATKKEEYKKFKHNYFSNHLSVAGIVRTSDNKILIGSDLTFKNGLQSWKFPGGFFDAEKDKTILNCLEREFNEEVGKLTPINNYIINIAKNIKYNFVAIICLCEIKESSIEIIEYNKNNIGSIVDNQEMQSIKFIDYSKDKINQILNCDLVSLSPTTIIGLEKIKEHID